MNSATKLAALAGFELLSPPFHGGSASVYKAKHLQSNNLVALKILHHGQNSKRIQQEARALFCIDHPHIARLLYSGMVADTAYLATKWIDGVSLARWIELRAKEGPPGITLERCIRLLEPIIDGIAYAHSCNVIHGDINPANIIVSQKEGAVLIDFGIGASIDNTTITAHDKLAGTPRYLAPELIKGQLPNALSDQYAIALVMYEVLSGQWPFGVQASSTANALHHQLYSDPVPLSEYRPDLPSETHRALNKSLNKLPALRYKNLDVFRDAILNLPSQNTKEPKQHALPKQPRQVWIHDAQRKLSSISGFLLTAKPAATFAIFGFCLFWVWRIPTDTFRTPDWNVTSNTHRLFSSFPLNSLSTTTTNNLLALNDKTDAQSHAETQQADFNANLPCNLYPNAGYDKELEQNFYRDKDNPNMAIRSETSTLPTPPSIKIGGNDVYGQYGLIIDIEPEKPYIFSAQLAFQGYVHRMTLIIIWLDEHWQPIPNADASLSVADKFDGRYALRGAIAPSQARYAVPTIFKDASTGLVFADDVFFATDDDHCKS